MALRPKRRCLSAPEETFIRRIAKSSPMSNKAVTIIGDKETSAELARIAAQLARPEAILNSLGRGLRRDLQDHFQKREQTSPNKHRRGRTHFWKAVRSSVQAPVTSGDGVSVTIAHEAIAAKVFGARIVAKNVSALTIPIHHLAHGRRASRFEKETRAKLFRIKSSKGNNLLMADLGGDGPVPIYALVKAVNVPRDPDALPPESALSENLINRGRAYLAKQLAGNS